MRGRPNDPVAARAKARAHAKHSHTCPCGRVVFGNGGWSSHKRACPVYQQRAAERELKRDLDPTRYVPSPLANIDYNSLELRTRAQVSSSPFVDTGRTATITRTREGIGWALVLPERPELDGPTVHTSVDGWLKFGAHSYRTAKGQRISVHNATLHQHVVRLYGGTCPDHGEYEGLVCPGGYVTVYRGPQRREDPTWEDCGKPVLTEAVPARDILCLLRWLSARAITYLLGKRS